MYDIGWSGEETCNWCEGQNQRITKNMGECRKGWECWKMVEFLQEGEAVGQMN